MSNEQPVPEPQYIPIQRRSFDDGGRPSPIAPRGWANGGVRVVGSLTPEDIQAIAVAVVDEMERRKNE